MTIRENILRMSAYKPPLEGRSKNGYLLLDFNERTTPIPPHITEALIGYINTGILQRYPEYGDFIEKLAHYTGVAADEIMITNGSDHGIDLIFRLVAKAGDEAIIPAPSFAMFTHCAYIADMQVFEPVYNNDYQFPLQEVMALISPRTKIIILCNPNNPTGTLIPKEAILQIMRKAPHAAILVDECYFEYTGETVKNDIKDYPNLFITRTFSKTWGLASLRLGYLISNRTNIENLKKICGPYDINSLAVVAARAALEKPSYMQNYVTEINEISRPMFLAFLERKKIRYWPTVANFVLFYPPDSNFLLEHLKKYGILARPRSGPNIEGTMRITLGTQQQTEQLIKVLEQVL